MCKESFDVHKYFKTRPEIIKIITPVKTWYHTYWKKCKDTSTYVEIEDRTQYSKRCINIKKYVEFNTKTYPVHSNGTLVKTM